jgi:hypothetical protein
MTVVRTDDDVVIANVLQHVWEVVLRLRSYVNVEFPGMDLSDNSWFQTGEWLL